MSNRLKEMWDQQESFMTLLQKERNFPEFPVNISTKSGQKIVKEVAHECMHELFEAIHLLSNSKTHRLTNVEGFNKEDFLEELSDTFHYFIEVCILSGITEDEFYNAYMNKGDKNVKRIKSGY